MALSMGENVTVIGSNSISSNRDIVPLPLPGGISMWFTGLGVYTLERGKVYRIGLAPDIRVNRNYRRRRRNYGSSGDVFT